MNNITSIDSLELISDNYIAYSKYLTSSRVYPSVFDGLKTVYRRCLVSSDKYKKMTKTPAHVGEAIKIHPHGSDSIESVINTMTCKYSKLPLYTGKGNFGGLGTSASSSRYTSTYLNEFSRLCFLDLVDYAEYVEGEVGDLEPKYLPSYIPYSLVTGTTSISSGMPNPNIPSYNLISLIEYYRDKVKGETPKYPRLDLGEIIVSEDNLDELEKTGEARIYFRPLVYTEGNKVVIKDSTPRLHIKDLEGKLSRYIDQDIIDYNDESNSEGYRVVLSLGDKSGDMDLAGLVDLVYKYMKGSTKYKTILEINSKAIYCNLEYISDMGIKYLKSSVIRMAESKKKKYAYNYELLRAIEKLKSSKKIFKNLPSYSKEEFIDIMKTELDIEEEYSKSILGKSISYLTRSHETEIDDLSEKVALYDSYISDPSLYLIPNYDKLLELAKIIEQNRPNRPSVYYNDMDSLVVDSKVYFKRKDNTIHISKSKDRGYSDTGRGIYSVTASGEVQYIDLYEALNSSDTVELDNVADICTDYEDYITVINNYGGICTRPTSYISKSGEPSSIFRYDGCDVVAILNTSKDSKIKMEYIQYKTKPYESIIIDTIDTVPSRFRKPKYYFNCEYGLDVYEEVKSGKFTNKIYSR